MALNNLQSRVAVVIPARDAAGSLGDCLQALQREGVPGDGGVLVVADDASSDDTSKVAIAAGAIVVRGHGRGPAAARNLGAHAVESEFLVFLDADTVPLPGWLNAMLAPFANADVVAVKGRYVSRQRSIVARYSQLEFEEKYARLERATRVDFVDTGTAAFRRAVFDSVGGFDESFPAQSAEDVELAFRLAAQGARFEFSPSARVLHVHASSLIEFLRKKARYGFFRVTVYRRHPGKLTGDSYTPPWMGIQIVLAGLLPCAILASMKGASAWPAGVGLAAFGLSCWPLLRRAWATDRALLAWVVSLSYSRAFAQGLGLAAGLVATCADRLLARVENIAGALQ